MNAKIAIITGGANGIGRSITEKLAARGVKVAICDIDVKKGEHFASELNSKFGRKSAIFIQCDVSNKKSFEECFEKTKSSLGNVDILINNAGIWDDSSEECFEKTKSSLGNVDILINNAGIWDDSSEGWEREVNINFKGPVIGSLLALKYMGKKSGGRGGIVLNVASKLGLCQSPFMPIYSGTKAAVICFSRDLGTDFHYNLNGIKFLTLCPQLTGGTDLFSDLEEKFIIPGQEMVDLFKYSHSAYQSVEAVAAVAVHVLDKGKNGSVWTVGLDQSPEEFIFKDTPLHVSKKKHVEQPMRIEQF